MKKLRIGIVGAGRMGRIRARSAELHFRCKVAGVADIEMPQAESLATEFGCIASPNWSDLVRRDDIDAVVVATPPKYLATVSAAALTAGKHVFCEKPGARTAAEEEAVLRLMYGSWPRFGSEMSLRTERCGPAKMVVGFTLRHHPAVAQARRLLARGDIGKPMYLVGRYGHGGRPGYEKEWRARRDLAGGGELLDQGVHLIDLSRWFLGEFEQVTGFVGTYFWRPDPPSENSALEDNAFLLLRSSVGRVASLHASWTQWKNLFHFEVYGEEGFLQIRGLGGSYGEEELVLGRRNVRGGPPETTQIALSSAGAAEAREDVWALEWQAFVNSVLDVDTAGEGISVTQPASPIDAWQALRISEAAYETSRTGVTLPLRQPATAISYQFTRKTLANSGQREENNDSV